MLHASTEETVRSLVPIGSVAPKTAIAAPTNPTLQQARFTSADRA